MGILDRRFNYTPSFATDIKKRFAKIERDRKAMERERAKEAEKPAEAPSLKVVPILMAASDPQRKRQ